MTTQAIVLNEKNPLTKEVKQKAGVLMAVGYPYDDAVLSVMKSDDRLRRMYFRAEKIITNGNGSYVRRVRRDR
jgi:hypothetical protein